MSCVVTPWCELRRAYMQRGRRRPHRPHPKEELQQPKSWAELSGAIVRAYLASEVVDDCRLADMMRMWYFFGRRGWLKMQQMSNTSVNGWNQERS